MSRWIRIERWSVEHTGGDYDAPEITGKHLKGRVYGHPNFADGEAIRTSNITNAEGRIATVSSGRVYWLGAAHPTYTQWMTDQGLGIDPENPITMLGKP